MELEILFHVLWWFGERLGQGDVMVWWAVINVAVMLIIVAACELWDSKGKHLFRPKRNPRP